MAPARRPGGNPRWIKDSELRNGTWIPDPPVDPAHDHRPKLWSEWGDDPWTPVDYTIIREYSLVNYDGTWAPGPENWDTRPGFANDKREENIEAWLEQTTVPQSQKPAKEPFHFTMKDPNSGNFHQAIPDHRGGLKRYYFATKDQSKHVMGPIAPEYWRPDSGTFQSLGELWKNHVAEAPRPCDEHDLQDVKPWWDQAPSPLACFLLPLEHPELKGIDPNDETPEQYRKRLSDQGSEGAIKQYMNRPRKNKNKNKPWLNSPPPYEESPSHADSVNSQTLEPGQLEGAEQDTKADDPYDLSFKPQVSMFLRRGHASDMAQATEIYNHYVANTVRVPEVSAVSPNHMLERFRAIKSVTHTFVVACLDVGPGQNTSPVLRGRRGAAPSHDRIIGFAYSDDFNDPAAMYRFVAEVEVYVHPEFSQKGIASCLMDRLICLLDSAYSARGGYDIRDEHLGLDPTRWITCLWINFPHVPEENDEEWMTKWLTSFGFEQTGNHKKIAFKHGKLANLNVYTRYTGIDIDYKHPPPPLFR